TELTTDLAIFIRLRGSACRATKWLPFEDLKTSFRRRRYPRLASDHRHRGLWARRGDAKKSNKFSPPRSHTPIYETSTNITLVSKNPFANLLHRNVPRWVPSVFVRN